MSAARSPTAMVRETGSACAPVWINRQRGLCPILLNTGRHLRLVEDCSKVVECIEQDVRIEHCNGLGHHDSTYARVHRARLNMLARIEPRGTSMKTVEIAPVSNRAHRKEGDRLTYKVKIGQNKNIRHCCAPRRLRFAGRKRQHTRRGSSSPARATRPKPQARA